jgi:hypothetical protein
MGKGVSMPVKKVAEKQEEAQVPELDLIEDGQKTRGVGGIRVHVVLATGDAEPKLEWNIKIGSAFEMKPKVQALCKKHGKKYPADVLVQDIQQKR